ncbi:MAG: DUF4974 domain-containing protein [Sphingobacteriales bacterium]|nr:MAG: DUF4974 domain-containing protein [Sphingobacteriales bacterium]
MEDQMYITMAKILNGEATAAEQQEFRTWLAADPRNTEAFNELKAVWTEADVLLEAPRFAHEPAWDKVSSRLFTADKAEEPARKVIAFRPWMKYMTAAAAVLAIGVIFLKNFNQEARMVSVLASADNQEITLPDNSHITLKKGSKLEYPKKFDEAERHVALEGEAFFDVTRNEKQPFTIDAGAATVRVLGTSFDVKSGKEVAVVVSTGKVSVTSMVKEDVSVVLTPGEKGIVSDSQAHKQTVRSDNHLYWKTGELLFSNKSLEHVLGELQAYTGSRIRFADKTDAEVKEQEVNISFHKQSLENMLTDLCLVTKTRWTKKGSEYIISSKQNATPQALCCYLRAVAADRCLLCTAIRSAVTPLCSKKEDSQHQAVHRVHTARDWHRDFLEQFLHERKQAGHRYRNRTNSR